MGHLLRLGERIESGTGAVQLGDRRVAPMNVQRGIADAAKAALTTHYPRTQINFNRH